MISASPIGWNPPGSTPGGLAHANPLPKFPAGRRATTRLAARQARKRHRITVIHATGDTTEPIFMDRRECGVTGRGALLVVVYVWVGFSLAVSG
jgi:hypothetical protein